MKITECETGLTFCLKNEENCNEHKRKIQQTERTEAKSGHGFSFTASGEQKLTILMQRYRRYHLCLFYILAQT